MFIYYTIILISMSQYSIWMALAVIGGLFLLVGVQTTAYAQAANDTSMMMGNMTNASSMSGNSTNSTGEGNWTGNISGCGKRC
jgi:hypothetical protein